MSGERYTLEEAMFDAEKMQEIVRKTKGEAKDYLGAEEYIQFTEDKGKLYEDIKGPGLRNSEAGWLSRQLVERGVTSISELADRKRDDVAWSTMGYKKMKYLDKILLNHGLSYLDETLEDIQKRVDNEEQKKESVAQLSKELWPTFSKISISPGWYQEVLEVLFDMGVRNYSDFLNIRNPYNTLGPRTYNKFERVGVKFGTDVIDQTGSRNVT